MIVFLVPRRKILCKSYEFWFVHIILKLDLKAFFQKYVTFTAASYEFFMILVLTKGDRLTVPPLQFQIDKIEILNRNCLILAMGK